MTEDLQPQIRAFGRQPCEWHSPGRRNTHVDQPCEASERGRLTFNIEQTNVSTIWTSTSLFRSKFCRLVGPGFATTADTERPVGLIFSSWVAVRFVLSLGGGAGGRAIATALPVSNGGSGSIAANSGSGHTSTCPPADDVGICCLSSC